MPIALERSYVTDVDFALPDTSTALLAAKSVLWCMAASLTKDILFTNCGAVTAWTVVGSSDSATAGLDGVNRWGTSFDGTKIVRGAVNGTNANSWIVLKHPTVNIWLTIQFVSAADTACTMVVARVAPTGGTTLSRPTSTSERVFLNGSAFIDSSTTAGKCHRVFDSASYPIICFSRNGSGRILSLLAIQAMADTKPDDTDPWCVIWDQGVATSALRYDSYTAASGSAVSQWLGNTTTGPCTGWIGGTTVSVLGPGFWVGSNVSSFFGGVLTAADSADSKFDDIPVFMLGFTVATIKGRLYDWRISAGPSLGDIYPAVAPGMTHLYIGNCWVPFTAQPTT